MHGTVDDELWQRSMGGDAGHYEFLAKAFGMTLFPKSDVMMVARRRPLARRTFRVGVGSMLDT